MMYTIQKAKCLLDELLLDVTVARQDNHLNGGLNPEQTDEALEALGDAISIAEAVMHAHSELQAAFPALSPSPSLPLPQPPVTTGVVGWDDDTPVAG